MKFLAVRDSMLNDTDPASSSASVELQELVDHLNTFQFKIQGNKSTSLDSRMGQHHDPMANMLQWDLDIRERCQPSSIDDIPSFHYILVDGANSIAISKKGSGFALVDLVMQGGRDASEASSKNLLLSGILQVQFASDSSRLSSASWTVSQYHPSFSVHSSRQVGRQDDAVAASSSQFHGHSPSSTPSSMSPNETLENQMIHPSVISLDLKASPTATTEENGPGMAI
jgi:hypothetical protein